MLELRLLGPLEIRDGDRVLTVSRLKPRALLAVLALNAGRVVSKDRLVDDLWGERAPKTARHALENYVSQLRQLLGGDVLATRPPGYVLELDPTRVDALQFERLVRAARGDERIAPLQEALALVRGRPLEDVAEAPFAAAEASRLEELEVAAREDLIDAQLDLGAGAELVTELEGLIARHPFRERLRGELMLALYRSGRQADALAAYQAARTTLVEELGIDPGDELQELEREILRRDPGLRAPIPVTAGPVAEPAPRRAGRKTVTIAVAGLSTGPLDPEALQALLGRSLATAREIVERHGGAAEMHGAGAIASVFGVPTVHEDDALRAVRAAAELRDALAGLDPRIGLGTGEVYVAAGAGPVTGDPVTRAEELARCAGPGEVLLAAETQRLAGDAVEGEPLPDLVAMRLVTVAARQGRALRLDSPLVGRERQLAALSSAFKGVVADRTAHLFTVLGAAGVGKSRLLGEFAPGLPAAVTVLQGRCLPYGEGVTFWPLVEAIRDAVPPEDDASRRLLALVDEHASPADVNEAAGTLFEAMAGDGPLVVCFDDLHWAEQDFLDLVEHLAGSRGLPMLVVGLARPELLDARPGWAGGKVNASSVLLEPLTDEESGRLIDNLLGPADLPEVVRDYVVATAEGNPLFVEEMLASLVDQAVLVPSGQGWTTVEMPALTVPPSVQALIAARIDRLPDEERIVLELASIEGKRFHSEAVAELAPDEMRPRIYMHLAALVRKELLRPRPGQMQSFAFRHQLVCDAACDSMPKQVRAGLHDRFADWLEAQAGGAAETDDLVTHHRDQARGLRAQLRPV